MYTGVNSDHCPLVARIKFDKRMEDHAKPPIVRFKKLTPEQRKEFNQQLANKITHMETHPTMPYFEAIKEVSGQFYEPVSERKTTRREISEELSLLLEQRRKANCELDQQTSKQFTKQIRKQVRKERREDIVNLMNNSTNDERWKKLKMHEKGLQTNRFCNKAQRGKTHTQRT